MKKIKESLIFITVLFFSLVCFTACQKETGSAKEGKTFIFGDTTFNTENEEGDINPHNAYAGWACVRYGIGETLFKFTDEMQLESWIAEEAKNIDARTWQISLKDNVNFSNGRKVDAQAVKECLEHLVSVHKRAANDLKIKSIEADGLLLTIRTEIPKPTLINYLCDPYGCIIDVSAGFENGIVVGSGPYVAKKLIVDDSLELVKNENYWNGNPKLDSIKVITITDGDTLALALQNGDIDAAYGMAYSSYPLFKNKDYKFSSISTSRAFYCQMNFNSPIIQDSAVRKAVAMGIDKESFVNILLDGNGYVGKGAFPDSFTYGGSKLKTENFDLEGAKKVLESAGWTDSDGDGIREKDGKKLSIRWLSYPSRQELPILAESVQASLKKIGIDVKINITQDHNSIVKNKDAWDIYGAAFVTCGIGDPMYFFTTHCLDSSTKNRGSYHNDKIESLAEKMNSTFDVEKRSDIAIQMQQCILDDNAFIFASFLKMSMISKSNVKGLVSHSCDYYEITSDLDM
ncbi:MAG: ABC transporter substrate-binding protein [Treponemataceae bacterium]|nr:ABC transporter substrate-binding protein [Treponemataceae bacterium]